MCVPSSSRYQLLNVCRRREMCVQSKEYHALSSTLSVLPCHCVKPACFTGVFSYAYSCTLPLIYSRTLLFICNCTHLHIRNLLSVPFLFVLPCLPKLHSVSFCDGVMHHPSVYNVTVQYAYIFQWFFCITVVQW